MKAEFNGEVKRAVFILTRNNSTLVSRRGIEEEILKTPSDYPNLSKLPKPSMRCIISRVMNEFYPRWEEGKFTGALSSGKYCPEGGDNDPCRKDPGSLRPPLHARTGHGTQGSW